MGMSQIPLILLPHPSAALLPHVPYSILSQESSLLSQECLEMVSTPVPHSSFPPISFSLIVFGYDLCIFKEMTYLSCGDSQSPNFADCVPECHVTCSALLFPVRISSALLWRMLCIFIV